MVIKDKKEDKHFRVALSPKEVTRTNEMQKREVVAMRINMDIQNVKGTIENLVKEITPQNKDDVLDLIADYRRILLYRFGMLKALVKPCSKKEYKELMDSIKKGEFKLI